MARGTIRSSTGLDSVDRRHDSAIYRAALHFDAEKEKAIFDISPHIIRSIAMSYPTGISTIEAIDLKTGFRGKDQPSMAEVNMRGAGGSRCSIPAFI